ncbi:hypothetical protein AB1Y20_021819 [Prymnesium parvum]|uniref:Reverse transcriptase domain-containing protein n=1 Tax=Prymnesium parvum TaxID=97485 RepID=A0AB34JJE3_PRYPA|mmetsp:Transcript_17686/g.26639  ORF Transcript_17686/g.26639 Transcript_17686/m.26639 type:complete len:184 (-) Transcript_17686:147-698(-)
MHLKSSFELKQTLTDDGVRPKARRIDLRFLNLHTRKCACVFEPLSSLRRMCRKGDWMCSLDLTDAYHHVPFHASALRYFTFAIETLGRDGAPQVEYFSTPVLNFGWTNSPFYFTEVMKAVVAYLRCPDRTGRARSHGVRLGVSAPPGFAYLGHSLRSGASSAAEVNLKLVGFRTHGLHNPRFT